MTPVVFDLSARIKIRVKGPDAFRFLNGQITNNLQKATTKSAIQASLLTAKGKLSAHVFISAESDGSFLLDADPELGEALTPRIERYIIADDVETEDVTDQFSLFHVIVAAAPEAPWIMRAVDSNRFGEPGFDLWLDRSQEADARAQLSGSLGFAEVRDPEVFRIEQGIPRWGSELTGEIIPIEANLEEASIDYAKGCYLGQEVISRMKMSGQTNKRLRGLIAQENAPLRPGMQLWTEDEAAKEVGWVTSATRSSRLGKEIALAYVKRGFNNEGARLLARGENDAAAIVATVVPLPFG